MNAAPATRKDIDDVLDVIRDLTTMMADRFEAIDIRFQAIEDKYDQRFETIDGTLNRIENKLDATVHIVDDHESRIRVLEHDAA